MSKLTFKEFLIEADLQIQQKHGMGGEEFAARGEAKGKFQQGMAASSPSQGDVIQTKGGYFLVVKMSVEGITLKQAGGDKVVTIPHGTKFKNIGTTEGGKPKFVVMK